MLKPYRQEDLEHVARPLSPLQEDKWFPLDTCCGCGCSFSGSERVYCLIYDPVFVQRILAPRTRGRGKQIPKKAFFSRFGLKDVAQRRRSRDPEEAQQIRYHRINTPDMVECVSTAVFSKILCGLTSSVGDYGNGCINKGEVGADSHP